MNISNWEWKVADGEIALAYGDIEFVLEFDVEALNNWFNEHKIAN